MRMFSTTLGTIKQSLTCWHCIFLSPMAGSVTVTFEHPHDKTNKVACDSDQPGRAQRILTRLVGRPG